MEYFLNCHLCEGKKKYGYMLKLLLLQNLEKRAHHISTSLAETVKMLK